MSEYGLIYATVVALLVWGCVAVKRPSAEMRATQDRLHREHLEQMKKNKEYYDNAK